MNEHSESPFFPVPVRWFEIPMNTARWGFMRPSDVTEVEAPPAKAAGAKRVESPAPATFASRSAATAASSGKIGTLLNERA